MKEKGVKTENRSTNIKETPIGKLRKEKSVKAVIQVIDEKGNPIGKPVEVYDYATIVDGEKVVGVKDKYGVVSYTSGLIVTTEGKEIPISGVYVLCMLQLLIDVLDDKVIVKPLRYFTLKYNIRRSGENKYRLMESEEVIGKGEYVDLKIPYIYREIDRQISRKSIIRKSIIPIVEEDVLIRIEARKLEPGELTKELYQQ